MSSQSSKGKTKARRTSHTTLANAFAQYQATSPNVAQEVALARKEVNAGFRPVRKLPGTARRSALPPIKQEVITDDGEDQWVDVDPSIKDDEDEPSEPRSAGRPSERAKSIKAIVWLKGGTESLRKLKVPDVGGCILLEQQHLAKVASQPGDIILDSEGTHEELYAAIAQYIPHPLQYFQSLQATGSGSVVIPIKVERSKFVPKHNEGLSGDEVFGRFPKNRGWKERFLFLTGPSAIPDALVDEWKQLGGEGATSGPTINTAPSPPPISEVWAPSYSKRVRSPSASPVAARTTRSAAKRARTQQDEPLPTQQPPHQLEFSSALCPSSPSSDIVMYEPAAQRSPTPEPPSSSRHPLLPKRFQLSPTTSRSLTARNPFARKAT